MIRQQQVKYFFLFKEIKITILVAQVELKKINKIILIIKKMLMI